MKTATKIAAGSLSAVVLAGLVGVGISYADDPTPTPSATPSSSPSDSPAGPQGKNRDKGEKQGEHRLIKKALHGEVTVGGKQTRVLDFQRGKVDEISATSVKVTSTDGFTKTYAVTGETRVSQAGEPGRIDDIEAGDQVRIMAVRDGDKSTATTIRERRS